MNFARRLSVGAQSLMNDTTDNEIDHLMQTLYPDQETLEKRCTASMYALQVDPTASKDITLGKGENVLRSAEAIVEELPLEYFVVEYDPVEKHLQEVSTWGNDNLIERFMNKIEATDTDKDEIIGLMTTMIDANYDELMECTRKVGVIENDLCRAGIQVNNGRRKLRTAMENLKEGAMKINTLRTKREKVLDIAETIKSLKGVKDIYQEMLKSITTGAVGVAAEHARNVVECLKTDSFDAFLSLQSIEKTMPKNVSLIRQKADKALNRLCCRKFASNDYESIVRAYLILDQLSETMKLQWACLKDDSDDLAESFAPDSTGCMDGLAQRVIRFQLEDIDACLHTAVMEYIYSSQHKKKKAAESLAVAGSFVPMEFGDIVDMTEIPLKLLYRRLPSELVAPCVTRTCELLADIIHTHFLLTQWHQAPFDSKNGNWQYLHRKTEDPRREGLIGIDSEDGDGGARGDLSSFDVDGESDDDDGDGDGETEGIEAEENEDDELVIHEHLKVSTNSFDGGDALERSPSTTNIASAVSIALTAVPQKKHPSASKKLHRHLQQMNRSHQISESVKSSIIEAYAKHLENDLVDYGGNGSDSTTARLVRLNSVKLAITHQNLIQSRNILWEDLLKALVDMLNITTITSAVKTDDFLSMICALNAMVIMGREFCGSESKPLRRCIERKSLEYFHNYHKESFQMNRLLIENENWMNVPVNLHSKGGILGIIETSIARDIQISSALSATQCRLSAYVQAKFAPPVIDGRNTAARRESRASESSSGNGDHAESVYISTSLSPTRSTSVSGSGCGESSSVSNTFTESESIFKMFGDLEGASPFQFSGKVDEALGSSVSNSDIAVAGLNVSSPDSNCVPSEQEEDVSVTEDGFLLLLREVMDTLAASNSNRKRAAEQNSSMVVTQSALNGLTKFVGKYLHLMYIMPEMSAQIFACMRQLFDFYMCEVFHGFIPSEEKNKFMTKPTKMNSTAPDQSLDFEILNSYIEHTMYEPLVQLFAATNHGAEPSTLEKTTVKGPSLAVEEGEIPQNAEGKDGVEKLMGDHANGSSAAISPAPKTEVAFLTPLVSPKTGRKEKDGSVSPISHGEAGEMLMSSLLTVPQIITHANKDSCFALNERIVAAESCCFVAKILEDVKYVLERLLVAEGSDPIRACMEYISSLQLVASQLRALVYRTACPMLVKQNLLIPQIVEVSWDSKKMRENSHEWVDALIHSCTEVWEYMLLTDQFAELSSLVREQVWLELCQCAFDTILEAFTKVRKVSAEGRASMTMDVFATHEELNSIHLCRPPRGKHHLDSFLRTSYLSEEDLIAWVRENWHSYAYRHMLGLLTQQLSSVLNSKKLKDAVAIIDGLYMEYYSGDFGKKDISRSPFHSTGSGSKMLSKMFSKTRESIADSGKLSQQLRNTLF